MAIYTNNKKIKDIYYNNKLIKSVYIDNQLIHQRAYAWKYSASVNKTTARILLSSSSASSEIACSSVGGAGNGVVVIDKKLYSYNTSTGEITQKGTDADYGKPGYGVVIKGGKLFGYYSNTNTYIDNETTWTHVGMGLLGIKNNRCWSFRNQPRGATATILNSTLPIKALITPNQDGPYGFALDSNGILYYLNNTTSGETTTQISSESGFTLLTSFTSSNYKIVCAKGNQIYIYNPLNNVGLLGSTSLDSNIKKLCDVYILTNNNEVYKINRMNDPVQLEFISSNVYDICLSGYIGFDGFYKWSGEKTISGVFGQLINQDNTYGAPNTVIFTPSGTTRTKTIYTTDKTPIANQYSYDNLKSSSSNLITSVGSNTIVVNGTTFTRDTSGDSYFTSTTNIA